VCGEEKKNRKELRDIKCCIKRAFYGHQFVDDFSECVLMEMAYFLFEN
jgi:hypothetical protein